MELLQQILALVGTHDWIALAILLIGLVQAWLSQASAFPVTIPDRYKAVVTVVLGQGYAVLLIVQAHQPWAVAVAHGVVTSLIVLLTSHAIWKEDAPSWARLIALFLQEANGEPQQDKKALKAKPNADGTRAI